MHHGTLFKHIYNNYSPSLFSSSYVQAKLAEVSFFVQYIYVCMYVCGSVCVCVCVCLCVCVHNVCTHFPLIKCIHPFVLYF